jgi:hypothetical protein
VRNRWVTTKKAKEILEKLGPWLDKRPPLRKFTDRLDATVETIWPLPRIAALYVALDRAIARLRGPLSEASSCLVEMEVAATEPDMVPVVEQLKLDDVRRILGSVNDLELALTHVPDAFPGRANKRRRRPKLTASFETSPKLLRTSASLSPPVVTLQPLSRTKQRSPRWCTRWKECCRRRCNQPP